MARDENSWVKGDRALTTSDDDKLGFREVAKRIAASLIDRASEDGLVIGVVSLGTAHLDDTAKARELTTLLATVSAHHFDDLAYRHHFAEQLPGVDIDLSEPANIFKIFETVSDKDRDEAIRKKRLASPDHYRLYFALIGPSHALTQDNFESTWAAAEAGAAQVGAALLRLHEESVAGSLTKADLLLERIRGGAYEILTPGQCENLLVAFAQVMDEAYRRHPFDEFWISSLWDRAQRLVPLLLSRLEMARRTSVVMAMFRDGAAIGWLTFLFRRDTFGHGRYGDSARPEREWLFTNFQLDEITTLMLDRYRTMSADDVLDSPEPISILFAWRQAGDEQGPRRLIEAKIASDEGLVETLEHLTSTIESSDRGRFNVLKRSNLAPFMDYEAAMLRIQSLKQHRDLGVRAQRLAAAFDDANRY
jgi:hypothetical protein